jgi:hypothetical protein
MSAPVQAFLDVERDVLPTLPTRRLATAADVAAVVGYLAGPGAEPRALAVVGLLVVAGAQLLLGGLRPGGSYAVELLPGLLLFGLGLGAAFVGRPSPARPAPPRTSRAWPPAC